MRGASGIFGLNLVTKSKQSLIETPCSNAWKLEACIVAPSAKGSLKGTPISIPSAPASIYAGIIFSVVSRSGKPAVRNNKRPTSPSSLILANLCFILLRNKA